jgi:hypothetical protein
LINLTEMICCAHVQLGLKIWRRRWCGRPTMSYIKMISWKSEVVLFHAKITYKFDWTNFCISCDTPKQSEESKLPVSYQFSPEMLSFRNICISKIQWVLVYVFLWSQKVTRTEMITKLFCFNLEIDAITLPLLKKHHHPVPIVTK